MTKVRKQKRKKTFKHTINRKKLNKKRKRRTKIKCDAIQEAWDVKQSVAKNLAEMGLASDPNVSLPIPKRKDKLKMQLNATTSDINSSMKSPSENSTKNKDSSKKAALYEKFPRLAVAERLERESKERKRKTLRLSQMQVDRLGYFIRTYQNDYKAMTRDRLNYDQNTWRQLRMQIKKFMEIPEQWQEYWSKIEHAPPERCIMLEQDETSD